MKNVRFIIGVTVLVGIAGCSTPPPNRTIGHQSDSPTAAMIEDARRLYEAGNIDAAEQKFLSVLAIEPNNRAPLYYLCLIKECRYKREAAQRSRKFWGYYPTYPLKPIYQ